MKWITALFCKPTNQEMGQEEDWVYVKTLGDKLDFIAILSIYYFVRIL